MVMNLEERKKYISRKKENNLTRTSYRLQLTLIYILRASARGRMYSYKLKLSSTHPLPITATAVDRTQAPTIVLLLLQACRAPWHIHECTGLCISGAT